MPWLTKTSPGHPPDEARRRIADFERKVSFGGTVVTDRKRMALIMKRDDPKIYFGEFVACVYNPRRRCAARELAARPEVRLILVTANLCAAATSPHRRQYRRLYVSTSRTCSSCPAELSWRPTSSTACSDSTTNSPSSSPY